MQAFMNDFILFFQALLSALGGVWNWLFSTIIGEILVFVLIITIFIFVIKKIVSLKD